ncbi:MAG: iron-sulfur cluster assembly scaffold protein [Bacteroidetes bacterium]|nr:iron-sulfur cluster assembly scaffold protein [Bacteroidota bacterium]
MDDMRKELLAALGYSPKAIALLEEESHLGDMEHPTIHVKHEAGCGDVLFLSLKITDDVIEDAAYQFVGCSGLQACASAMTEMIIGKRIDAVEHLQMQDIIDWLEGIPENKYECAESTDMTLHKAIQEYRKLQAA